jgi:hypothetical protein
MSETIEKSNLHYWIALNGPSCAMASWPMKEPQVSPVPQQLFGFPTYEEAKQAQKLCLTAPIKEVDAYIQSLGTSVKAGRVKYIRPANPESFTHGPTMWFDDGEAA